MQIKPQATAMEIQRKRKLVSCWKPQLFTGVRLQAICFLSKFSPFIKHAVTTNHVVIQSVKRPDIYSLHHVPSCLIWKWFCVDVQTTVSCLYMTRPAVVLFLCMEWIYQRFWNYTCLEFSSLSIFFLLYEILPAIFTGLLWSVSKVINGHSWWGNIYFSNSVW